MNKHKVTAGDTYTVTITRPISGDPVPLILHTEKARGDWDVGWYLAKAVTLKKGMVTISVNHTGWQSDENPISYIDLVNADTGSIVNLDDLGHVETEEATLSGHIKDDGVYVLGASIMGYADGAEVTISQ